MISIISDTFECPPPALIFIHQVDSCHPARQVSGWPRNGHLHSEPSDRGGKSPQPRPQASEREECGFCKFDNCIVLPSNQSKVSSVWSHQEVHHIYFPAGKIFLILYFLIVSDFIWFNKSCCLVTNQHQSVNELNCDPILVPLD